MPIQSFDWRCCVNLFKSKGGAVVRRVLRLLDALERIPVGAGPAPCLSSVPGSPCASQPWRHRGKRKTSSRCPSLFGSDELQQLLLNTLSLKAPERSAARVRQPIWSYLRPTYLLLQAAGSEAGLRIRLRRPALGHFLGPDLWSCVCRPADRPLSVLRLVEPPFCNLTTR